MIALGLLSTLFSKIGPTIVGRFILFANDPERYYKPFPNKDFHYHNVQE